ncbi:MAG: hypothetical protein ACXW3Z_02330 [Limisphaerales bacterium]
MPFDYVAIFWELIRKPFEHPELVWGIVPLYFSWAIGELTREKATFKTAIQTGFNLLWAGAQWAWQHTQLPGAGGRLDLNGLFAVNVLVTVFTILLGALALFSGLRRRFPRYCSFLGHTRFSSYLTIAIFPIQANYLKWSWDRLLAILLFAIPTWLLLGLLRHALAIRRPSGKSRS